MKDYSLGKNEQFILEYAVDGNNLVIRYTSGVIAVPYSLEAEKSILAQMEKQAEYYQFEGKDSDEYKKEMKKIINHEGFFFATGILSLLLPLVFSGISPIGTLIGWGSVAINFAGACINIVKERKLKKTYEDMEDDYNKSKLFLDYNETLKRVKALDMEQVQTKAEQVPAININTIDEMSLDALKSFVKMLRDDEQPVMPKSIQKKIEYKGGIKH